MNQTQKIKMLKKMKGTISSGAPFWILDVSQKKGAPKNKHTQIYYSNLNNYD